MKTLFIVPSLLLAAAVALGAPAASAAPSSSAKTIEVTFAYNRGDDAQQIYADLHRTARKACRNAIGYSTRFNWQIRSCTSDLVKTGIAMIARQNIADLYSNRA
jgi:UrcA family protein